MATRIGSYVNQNSGETTILWSGLLNTDDGRGSRSGHLSDLSVQAFGTFGAGGTVTIQGSADGTTWAPIGAGLTLTDGQVKSVGSVPAYIRPNITGGDGTTNLSVVVTGKFPR